MPEETREKRKRRPRAPRQAEFTTAELALFLEPISLVDAMKRGPQRRHRIFWSYAAARAETDGLLESPGKSPLWQLTPAGYLEVSRLYGAGRVRLASA